MGTVLEALTAPATLRGAGAAGAAGGDPAAHPRALESTLQQAAEGAARALRTAMYTTGGTLYMHEAFDADEPAWFTRPWFGWPNALFAELAMRVLPGCNGAP